MTWLRVDTTLPGEAVIGALAERLEVDVPTAVGLYVSTQLGFGDHRKDGMVDQVTDTSLEQWSGWRGARGVYAAAFRSLCVERREDEDDPVGRIKGWWRQEAGIRKQLNDAARRRSQQQDSEDARDSGAGGPSVPGGGEPPTSEEPAENQRGKRAGNARNVTVAAVAANENGNGKQQQVADAPVSELEYVRRCVGMANRGLRENPEYKRLRRSFNELTCSAQDAHHAWQAEGIPVRVAEQTVYDRASHFRPTPNRPQPGSLAYFSRPVREAWEQEQARRASAGLQVYHTPVLSEAEELARRLESEARGEEVADA